MPHPILMCMNGESTHKQVKILICKLMANLMAITCHRGHGKGHLGLLQDPVIYLASNGAPFTIPATKLPAVVPVGATTPQCEELWATYIAECQAWTTYCLILSTTRVQLPLPSMMSTMWYLTIQLKGSMNACLSCAFSQHIRRSVNRI